MYRPPLRACIAWRTLCSLVTLVWLSLFLAYTFLSGNPVMAAPRLTAPGVLKTPPSESTQLTPRDTAVRLRAPNTLATTPHAINVNGTVDTNTEWSRDSEKLGAMGGIGYWATWDQSNLYIGFKGTGTNNAIVAINTDPKNVTNHAGCTTVLSTQHTLSPEAKANYLLAFQAGTVVKKKCVNNAWTAWTPSSGTMGSAGTSDTEFGIKFSDLTGYTPGQPLGLYLFVDQGTGASAALVSAWPPEAVQTGTGILLTTMTVFDAPGADGHTPRLEGIHWGHQQKTVPTTGGTLSFLNGYARFSNITNDLANCKLDVRVTGNADGLDTNLIRRTYVLSPTLCSASLAAGITLQYEDATNVAGAADETNGMAEGTLELVREAVNAVAATVNITANTASSLNPQPLGIATWTLGVIPTGLGLERFMPYQDFALSNQLALHVNLWNGNLVLQSAEFNIPSRGLPLTLVHTYNSQTEHWGDNFSASLYTNPDGSITVNGGDGSEHLFKPGGNGSYTPPPGVFDTLVQVNGTYTLTHANQSSQRFDSAGRLTAVRDRVGNQLSLNYSVQTGALASVQAAGGQQVSYSYDTNCPLRPVLGPARPTRLQAVTDSANHAYQFSDPDCIYQFTEITDPLQHTFQFEYDGKLWRITDPRSTQTTIGYYGDGRVQTITTDGIPVGRFAYEIGRTTFTDGEGHATVYEFNGTGQVRKVTDTHAEVTTYQYDANYNRTYSKDPLDHITTAIFDDRGNLTRHTEALQQTTYYTYTPKNDLLATTDPLGHTTQYEYDDLGNRTVMTDALNFPTYYQDYDHGQPGKVIDANNHETRYSYSPAGYLLSVTDALTHTTAYGYDAIGNRTAITDAVGAWTHNQYDANNRVITSTVLLTGTETATTVYGYDAVGNQTVITNSLGFPTTYGYDAFNRQISVTIPITATGTATTGYGYDRVGNRTVITDANNHLTTYGYDELNRLITTTVPITTPSRVDLVTVYGYDAAGRRTSATDPRGHTTTYGYDAANRMISTTIPITVGVTATTGYGYDAVGRQTVITDARGYTTTMGYDADGRLLWSADALSHTTHYGYDRVGNRTVVTDTLNQPTRYDYDELNRVITVTNPAGKFQSAGYDAVGNKTRATDETNATTTYGYDKAHRVITSTVMLTQTTHYEYDLVGNLLTLTDPSALPTTLTYYPNNLLWTKTVSGTTTYTYDPVANVQRVVEPSGAYREFAYDEANRQIQAQLIDTGDNALVTYQDTLDENGHSIQAVEVRASRIYTETRGYNDANWLTTVTDRNQGTTRYTYDLVGNEIERTDPAGYTTQVATNAVNLPITTTVTFGSSGTAPFRSPVPQSQTVDTVTTFNRYDSRQFLTGSTTQTPTTLVLTATLNYNANGYLDADNVGQNSAQVTSTVAYYDNNLAQTIRQGSWTRENQYDGAQRVRSSSTGNGMEATLTYYENGLRKTKTWWNGGKETDYSYQGYRLTLLQRIGDPYSAYTETWNYDDEGNLHQMERGANEFYLPTTLTYTWEPVTHHLLQVTKSNPNGVTFQASMEYDRRGRLARYCPGANCATYGSGYLYSYVGDSDWISQVKREADNKIVERYLYANGRPLAVETSNDGISFGRSYYQYDWHGNVSLTVSADGNTVNGPIYYGAWGEYNPVGITRPTYLWNGGWGYLHFPANFNFNQHDEVDIGLYYAHGRWYNQETGLWLSPNEKGDYLYGGDGQDPINLVKLGSLSNSPSQQQPTPLESGNEAHRLIQAYCLVSQPFPCAINKWTGSGIADIVIEYPSISDVYEIKPNSKYGIQYGPYQVARYVEELSRLDPTRVYQIGTIWKPSTVLTMLGGEPLKVFTDYFKYPGVILYETTRTKSVVQPEVVPSKQPDSDLIWVLGGCNVVDEMGRCNYRINGAWIPIGPDVLPEYRLPESVPDVFPQIRFPDFSFAW